LCLAVDNTHTSVGLFDGAELSEHWLLSSDVRRTSDEWGLVLAGLLGPTDPTTLSGVCVCSAVPAVLQALRGVLRSMFEQVPSVILGPGVRTGLPVLTDSPRDVGTDRIANAVAAHDRVGAPCVVVDLGTATTFDVVNAAGQYIGGVIAPGMEISAQALGRYGAQLRQVELVRPRFVVARNTVEALQSGAIFGCAGQVDGILNRIADELQVSPGELPVVGTGVLAPVVLPDCRSAIRYEPHLTLDGLRIVFDRNS
jgi:type III pantothenate kinase